MAREHLTLVGLTENGTTLLLVSDTGEEYTVAADASLRAALRGEHTRFGQLEIEMDSVLRPRDIQARIRAGESPETVAAAAQTTVDRIMAFAAPVMAERAYVAERAQRASVRRRAGEGPARLLGDAVAERLRARNINPDDVAWDAWRREDGRWTLVADYLSGESHRHAEFLYDAPGRYVVAEDDEGRWLVGEQSSRKGPQPRPAGTGAGHRRLAAVTDDGELPLGADAIELVSEPHEQQRENGPAEGDAGGAGRDADDAEPASDLGEPEADERPSTMGMFTEDLSEEDPEGDPSADPEADLAEEHTTDLGEVARSVRTRDDSAPAEAMDEAAAQEGAAGDAAAEQEPPRAAKKSSRKGRSRASVPSWDEIMFGGGKSE